MGQHKNSSLQLNQPSTFNLLFSQTSKMMKLTLICMVASMVVLVAQAINTEEDADGFAKKDVRGALDYAPAVAKRRAMCGSGWCTSSPCCCQKKDQAVRLACCACSGCLCPGR